MMIRNQHTWLVVMCWTFYGALTEYSGCSRHNDSDVFRAYLESNVTLSWSLEELDGHLAIQMCPTAGKTEVVAEYVWGKYTTHRDNLFIDFNQATKDIRLHIINVSSEDAGIYSLAQAGNSKQTVLFIWGQPSSSNVTVSTVDVLCDVKSTSEPAEIRPGFEFVFYVNEEVYNTETDAIKIPTGSDTNNYSCAAREFGSILKSHRSAVIKVKSLYGPKSTLVKLTRKNGRWALECKTDCNPSCNISWFHKDNEKRLETSDFLFLSGQQEAFEWICLAENGLNRVIRKYKPDDNFEVSMISVGGIAAGTIIVFAAAALCLVRKRVCQQPCMCASTGRETLYKMTYSNRESSNSTLLVENNVYDSRMNCSQDGDGDPCSSHDLYSEVLKPGKLRNV